MGKLRLLLREMVFVGWIQLLVAGNLGQAVAAQKNDLPTRSEIIKLSQLSYRAEGGFTGVKSYSVLISCVDGKISTMRSILDPRMNARVIRMTGTMDTDTYLRLWNQMAKRAVLKTKNAPTPRYDIRDEFTVSFEARAGKHQNKFKAVACSRPEASKYFAYRSLMDQAVNMQMLWDMHSNQARLH